MSFSVLTRAYGNDRSGTNGQESVLTAAAVRSRGIKRLFSLPLPGDRRGAEAQPLIVPGVALPGGRTRDLVLLATMANQVFAFDANDGTPVWQRTLGTPITSSGRAPDQRPLGHSFDPGRRWRRRRNVCLRLDEPGRLAWQRSALASCA